MEQENVDFIDVGAKIKVYSNCINGFGIERYSYAGKIVFNKQTNSYVFMLGFWTYSCGAKFLSKIVKKLQELDSEGGL